MAWLSMDVGIKWHAPHCMPAASSSSANRCHCPCNLSVRTAARCGHACPPPSEARCRCPAACRQTCWHLSPRQVVGMMAKGGSRGHADGMPQYLECLQGILCAAASGRHLLQTYQVQLPSAAVMHSCDGCFLTACLAALQRVEDLNAVVPAGHPQLATPHHDARVSTDSDWHVPRGDCRRTSCCSSLPASRCIRPRSLHSQAHIREALRRAQPSLLHPSSLPPPLCRACWTLWAASRLPWPASSTTCSSPTSSPPTLTAATACWVRWAGSVQVQGWQ